MLEITSAKIAGNPGPAGWVQIYDFVPEDAEKVKLRGHLYAVISAQGATQGIENVVVGREIISRLHEEYFGKTEITSFNALKLAVEKVALEFQETLEKIEIAAVAQVENVVYSAATGGAQIAILRNQMFAKILVSSPSQTVSASGYPQEGDLLFVGTQKLFSNFSDSEIKENLLVSDSKIAAEQISTIVHSHPDESVLGALILKFSSQVDQSFIPTPDSPEPVEAKKKLNQIVGGIGQTLGGLFKKFERNIPPKKIFIKGEEDAEYKVSDKRSVTFTVGVILLILLVVSIVFGIRQKNIKDQKSKYEDRLTLALENYGQAVNLYEVEPEQARNLFIESENLAKTLEGEEVKDERLTKLISDLTSQRGKILGEYTEEPALFMDLTLLSSGFKGDTFAVTGKKVYVLDKSAKKIVAVTIDTKKTEIVAGPDTLKDVLSLAVFEDYVYVLDQNGISEVDSGLRQVVSKDWEEDVLVASYAGNLYLVDKKEGLIYRFPRLADGFGAKQNWLGEGVNPDFSKITGIAIDGSIWLTNETAKIFKFSLGSPQAFNLTTQLSPALTYIDKLFTSENEDNLFILDKMGKRIIVVGKNGDFIAQYTHDLLGQAQDIMASQEVRKIIILSDGKLYSLEISF